MSLILNFETSSKNCSVTLSSKGELLSNFDLEDDKYRHSELLTTTIRDILSQNNLSVKDLSAVAIGVGPGSFTGLRIGFSVAKGLCYPHKINLIGISSL
ncbi:MAG: tRNA (adenosine(37)-N6)-threonylcarbamoyltransferase complex dimerization subunit type 1 TsaB, partial [Bacteroidetes bacterium]|nr:tRNA (adenosine(37)-N6)-threonylcarbamoyltransferase complex dimerization subunit type 1 TsaB [Bacteroidota bacterium]